MIDIKIEAGRFKGYLALPEPAAVPAPGLIILQEIFGVNAVMRGITDQFAAAGFVALCPDLFWRIEPGIDITDQSATEWEHAFELFNAFDADLGVLDIQAATTVLRGHDSCSGRVGTVGYCLGGRLAYLTATRTDCDMAVGFYGVGIEDFLMEASEITVPLVLHIAGQDQFVPPAAQSLIYDALNERPQITLYDYPDDDHAFARVGGEHYNVASAQRAMARTLTSLRNCLC